MTSNVVSGAGQSQPGTKTGQAALVIHSSLRIVRGGRSTICDIPGNTNGAQEQGCEVVSSVWLPYLKVVYTLTYPNGLRQTFVDITDHRGHALHPFNVAYLPPLQARKGHPADMAQIEVVGDNSNGSWTEPRILHFAIRR
jgi:hypothetical protein